MKVWGSWAIVVACAATALLLAPAGAGAKPGYVTFPGDHRVELNLKGSHGYAIHIVGHNRGFELSANKKSMVVVYLLLHNRLRGDRVEAKLPGVGRVSLRFHNAGPAHTEPGFFPPCHGGETIKQPGYFLGRIRFRGERGYTTVHATRARGEVVATSKEICKRSIFNGNSEPKPEEHTTRLFAYSKSAGRVVRFFGSTPPFSSHPFTFFSGSATERREGMAIFREAVVSGKDDDLVTGVAGDFPLTATVAPPAPFHGSAAFQRMPGGNNAWTGSLSVNLPGAGQVALAGPDFSARLCQDSGCRRR
jgi:hypothetical protein